MSNSDALGLRRTGKLKAKQVEGAPNYPVQNLYFCAIEPHAFNYWLIGSLGLSEGVYVRSDGFVSFAPAMVTRMRIVSFRLIVFIDAFDEACTYSLKLIYTAKSGEHYEQTCAKPIRPAEQDSFTFDIPLEHVDREGWFASCLHIKLETPLDKEEQRQACEELGLENAKQPVLLRGAYLEIKG